MMNFVQAYILNMDFPHDIYSLTDYSAYPDSITTSYYDIAFSQEKKMTWNDNSEYEEIPGTGKLEGYTVPRQAMVGDIIFFMCQSSATQTFANLRKQVYDLSEKNISYKEFIKWNIEYRDVGVNENWRDKTDITVHFLHDADICPEDEADDIIFVRCNNDRSISNIYSSYEHNNIFGHREKSYFKLYELIKQKKYPFLRFKHFRAATILLNLRTIHFTAQKFAGKIYAVGVISAPPEQYKDVNLIDWKHGILTDFDRCFVLDNPIELSSFKERVQFRQRGTFTPVLGQAFEYLKGLIIEHNETNEYFINSVAVPVPLSKINSTNWLEITNKYRRSFCLEDQFREYYVNKLLPYLGDQKKYYMECKCHHIRRHYTQVDNVILFLGKYLPVEVKLNINLEKDIKSQCNSYCKVPVLELNKEKKVSVSETWQYVLIIDREAMYLYQSKTDSIKHVLNLDKIQNNNDILSLRKTIENLLK